MRIVRGADINDVDGRIGDHFLRAGIRGGNVEIRADPFGSGKSRRAYARDLAEPGVVKERKIAHGPKVRSAHRTEAGKTDPDWSFFQSASPFPVSGIRKLREAIFLYDTL